MIYTKGKNVVDRIQRILRTGELVAVDKSKLFIMADEVLDPSIGIAGQYISVWGNSINILFLFYKI